VAALTPLELLVAAAPDALLPSRIQMAFTLAYHIILVPFGVAFPLFTVLMERIGLRNNDPVALKLARRWSVVMAVQFAVGAVTGTILSFEFGILWPRTLGLMASSSRSKSTIGCATI
jgi:cytochrome d ubiquinol oxidase subunit I